MVKSKMAGSSSPVQVSTLLVVYPHLPHYRRAVFELLDDHPSLEVTFAADVLSAGGSAIPTVPFGVFRRSLRLRNVWVAGVLWQRGLLGHLLKTRYDHAVLLGDAKYLTTWLALLVLRLRGTRTHLWTIGWHKPDSGLRRFIRVLFYRLGRGLMLYGVDGAEMAVEAGIPTGRITVVGNSQNFAPKEAEVLQVMRDRVSGIPTVGAVVRLTAWKRLDLLLRAASVLRERAVEVRILLVGDGPERENLEALASELGVSVDFTGAVYDTDRLHDLLGELDLTVMPEVAGLTVMQSLSFGIPVITVDDPDRQAPEFRAVVPGVTGGLYEAGNVAALADEIEGWLGRLERDREAIARACIREVNENWSPESNMKRIVKALGIG